MTLLDTAQSARARVAAAVQQVAEQGPVAALLRLAQLERVLAILCIGIPVLLIAFDGDIRGSISAYYDMAENQIFYFGLTAATMMFIVNGVVRRRHWYNVYLGLTLAGVILFNHDDFDLIHGIFAVAFFGGNFLVILLFSGGSPIPGLDSKMFKSIFVGAIVAAMLGHFVFDWYSLFWAEWISFAAIALHYILSSISAVDYRATPGRGEQAPAFAG